MPILDPPACWRFPGKFTQFEKLAVAVPLSAFTGQVVVIRDLIIRPDVRKTNIFRYSRAQEILELERFGIQQSHIAFGKQVCVVVTWKAVAGY
jgi:hypothetical protein